MAVKAFARCLADKRHRGRFGTAADLIGQRVFAGGHPAMRADPHPQAAARGTRRRSSTSLAIPARRSVLYRMGRELAACGSSNDIGFPRSGGRGRDRVPAGPEVSRLTLTSSGRRR